MISNSRSTILVKRADGTSVRMPLDEFKKMKTSSSTQILGSPSTSLPNNEVENNASEPSDKELKIEVEEIKKKINEDIEKAKSGQKIALTSAQIPEIKKSKKEDEEALEELKDYNVENIETLKNPETLPLTEIEVIAPKEPANVNRWESDDHKSLLDEEFHKEIPVLVKEGEHILARTAPVIDVFVNEAKYETEKMKDKPSGSIKEKPEIKIEKPPEKKFDRSIKIEKPKSVKSIDLVTAINARSTIKPLAPRPLMPSPKPLVAKDVIQDVKPPKVEKQSVGPVDELLKFTLWDFRRLGANMEDSSMRLREKFKYLEEDSYLTFMDGVEAWYNSPIYKQYQEVISKSLNTKMTVSEVLSGVMSDDEMKLDEFRAILRLNQSLY